MIKEEKTNKVTVFALLHILLFVFSLGGICSKLAGQSEFFSPRFFFFYGLVILDLGIYAIAWQQILKRIPLVTAYANKAVTIIWGLIWGFMFFQEPLTIQKILGALIIVAGVVLVVQADEQ